MTFSQEVWQRNLDLYQKYWHYLLIRSLPLAILDSKVLPLCHSGCTLLTGLWPRLAVAAAKAFDADDVIQFSEAAKLRLLWSEVYIRILCRRLASLKLS